MTKPPAKHDPERRGHRAVRGDPTLELEHGSVDDGEQEEFDGPTQLVDASSYAATVKKTQQVASEEQPEEALASLDDQETVIRPRSSEDEREQSAAAARDARDAGPSSDEVAPVSGGGLFPDIGVQLPQKLGQYTLVEVLGLGGMAEVFLAQQDGPSGFRRKLVIKRIHPHLSVDERFVQMFLREARVAAGLQHRNIVRIDELGADKGIYFIAMEFVDGLTLQRLARRAWRHGLSLPMELVVSAAADAATALHYAHSYVDPDGTARRIVHRDVSPDNLIVDRAGNTKLLDFGVAKAAGSISVTRAGEVKGKVPYMAPEQLHGRPLDGRADLYSLGATLYWLLTGKRPFRGETDLEVMQAIAYTDPPSPRALNAEIPEVLERIILRLLAKKPEERHANGQQLADELTAMLLPSRREVASFVEECMALDNPDDSEPISVSSFIAATPRTAHFITESRRLWLERYLPEKDAAGPSAVDSGSDAAASQSQDALDVTSDAAELEDADIVDDAITSAVTAPEAHALAGVGADPALLVDAAASLDANAGTRPDVAVARRPPLVAIGAGAAAAVLLAIVGWAFSGSEEAPLLAPPPPVLTTANADAKATPSDDGKDWNFLGEDADPASDDDDDDAPAPDRKQVAPPDEGENSAPVESEPKDDGEPAVDVKLATATPSETPPSDSGGAARTGASQARRTAAATSASTMKVKASGPANVAWKLGRRTLGSGNTTLEVPEGTSTIVAYHRARKVQTRIPVQGGQVRYDDAPTGTLDIRVLPYATVYAGSERLWKVPAPPRSVPAGTYKLRIEYEGKSKTETVVVEAGATAKVRVNMME